MRRGWRGSGMHWRGDKVREVRLRWFGHEKRRDHRYVGRTLRMELPGKKKRGRPRGGLRMWRGMAVRDLVKIFQLVYETVNHTTVIVR